MTLLIERHGHEAFHVDAEPGPHEYGMEEGMISLEAFGENATRLMQLGADVFHMTLDGTEHGMFARVYKMEIRPHDAAFIFSLESPKPIDHSQQR